MGGKYLEDDDEYDEDGGSDDEFSKMEVKRKPQILDGTKTAKSFQY